MLGELKGRYSIKSIPCQEPNVAAELPLFLEDVPLSLMQRQRPVVAPLTDEAGAAVPDTASV